jgi:hypothetical protein
VITSAAPVWHIRHESLKGWTAVLALAGNVMLRAAGEEGFRRAGSAAFQTAPAAAVSRIRASTGEKMNPREGFQAIGFRGVWADREDGRCATASSRAFQSDSGARTGAS